MKRISIVLGLIVSTALHAEITQTFRDNTNLNIVLSDTNYNRLVVREDKIIQAHFPESSMGAKNEDDGSLYVLSNQKEPFTLFLSTERGHHFSATVNTESSLGKTIEFVPQRPPMPKKLTNVKRNLPKQGDDTSVIDVLMTHMIQKTPLKGFDVKRHYGRAVRLQQGLVLLPRLTYLGQGMLGDVTEIYNGGRLALELDESWFVLEGVKAISLSTHTLGPKQKAFVYRIMETHHG